MTKPDAPVGSTRLVREYVGNTPDGPMWLTDEVISESRPDEKEPRAHCPDCGMFNDLDRDECRDCGAGLEDANEVNVRVANE